MADRNFVAHEACPECGSANNLAVYDDGYAKCFGAGCDYYHMGEGTSAPLKEKRVGKSSDLLAGAPEALMKRHISY